PAARPLANTVLPAPRSPLNRKTVRSFNCSAMCCANAKVVSGASEIKMPNIVRWTYLNMSCVRLISLYRLKPLRFSADSNEGFAVWRGDQRASAFQYQDHAMQGCELARHCNAIVK